MSTALDSDRSSPRSRIVRFLLSKLFFNASKIKKFKTNGDVENEKLIRKEHRSKSRSRKRTPSNSKPDGENDPVSVRPPVNSSKQSSRLSSYQNLKQIEDSISVSSKRDPPKRSRSRSVSKDRPRSPEAGR